MNGQPAPPPGTAASQPGAESAAVATPRPWTPAAAMEPVPPLAPPPARPGAGRPVAAAARPASTGTTMRTLLGLATLALMAAAVVFLVFVLGH